MWLDAHERAGVIQMIVEDVVFHLVGIQELQLAVRALMHVVFVLRVSRYRAAAPNGQAMRTARAVTTLGWIDYRLRTGIADARESAEVYE